MEALTEIRPVSDEDREKLGELFEPLNDFVVLAIDEQERTTAGGILLPENTNANMTPQSGTVVAIGPGAVAPGTGERVPLTVKVGDRVLHAQYAGSEMRYGDVLVKTLREADLLSIVHDDMALQPETVRLKRAGK